MADGHYHQRKRRIIRGSIWLLRRRGGDLPRPPDGTGARHGQPTVDRRQSRRITGPRHLLGVSRPCRIEVRGDDAGDALLAVIWRSAGWPPSSLAWAVCVLYQPLPITPCNTDALRALFSLTDQSRRGVPPFTQKEPILLK